jgi:hypothetical protein
VTLQDCIIAKDAGSRRVCVAILLTELINTADNGLTVNTPVAAIRYGKSAQKFHVVEILYFVFVKLFRLPCVIAQLAEVQTAMFELPVCVRQ